MGAFFDLAGQTFGRLKVIRFAGKKNTRPVPAWLCRCECGTERIVDSQSLKSGNTRSCGCLKATWKPGEGNCKHGESRVIGGRSPEYTIWAAMLRRCENPRVIDWKNYGGRGIKVCERWRNYENFLADMGRRPPNHSIDRINNDAGYEPSNCRWATKGQQANNTRKPQFTKEQLAKIALNLPRVREARRGV